MLSSLDGLTAVVTGAGSGIGEATAEDLASIGVRVALVGRRPDRIGAVVDRIVAAGHQAVAEPGDIREYAQVQAIVERTVEKWGSVDIFVANAAVVEQSMISDGDPQRWRDVIETNVLGTLHSVRAVLPQMLRQGHGHVVIVSSVSGRVTYVGEPAYVASKHALVAMGDVLRQEVAKKNIRVTLIEPGLVATEFFTPEFAFSLLPGVTPLQSSAVAASIRFALEQPPEVSINELVIRPTGQIV
jgi:NADP-dependent 3-hydroxy acid dehydrogenase YdfG